MATDDKSKPTRKDASSPSEESAPKKKKKRPADVAATEPSESKAAKAKAAAREESDDDASEALVVRGGESTAIDRADGDEEAGAPHAARDADEAEDSEEEEGTAPAQLGSERYVMAAFFAAGLIGAYVLGRIVHTIWASLANRDIMSQHLPQLAAVPDDTKSTLSTVLAGVIALVTVVRVYRRPDVRAWSDDVASELTKVKWPTKKDVTSSTLVVIAASCVATIYLALLDRLWSFITNLVYGTGT